MLRDLAAGQVLTVVVQLLMVIMVVELRLECSEILNRFQMGEVQLMAKHQCLMDKYR